MKAEIEGKKIKLPDFLIVGAARSGTTSLYNYLNQHPKIFMPRVKEPFFFAFSGKPTSLIHHATEIIWRFEDYVKLFEPAEVGQLLGEASAIYLYLYEETIRNIKQYMPRWKDLKVIIILREPVERAFSMYSLFRMLERESAEFEEAIDPDIVQKRLNNNWTPGFDYVGFGFYYQQVKAYMDNFPLVKVILYDDLKKDALGLIKDIFSFLEIDGSFVPDLGEKHNPSGTMRLRRIYNLLQKPNLVSSMFPFIPKIIPLEKRVAAMEKLRKTMFKIALKKKHKMKEDTRQYLKSLYRSDILKLQDLINRDLSSWVNDPK